MGNNPKTRSDAGVGYGWMQQVIEILWEWQHKGLGALGPEFYHTEIARLNEMLTAAVDDYSVVLALVSKPNKGKTK
jgi:hypothetical protein